MKIFLFSKRFLIPLFIVWFLQLAYTEWEVWRLWRDDFKGKGIPSSVIYRWLLLQLTPVMVLSFVNSFLVALVFYSHYQVRKERSISSKLFSKWNLLAVILISLLAFLYSSFIEPANGAKNRALLAEIVWARAGEKFGDDSLRFTPRATDSRKNPRAMNIRELFNARDSLKVSGKDSKEFNFPYINQSGTELRTVEFLINKKFALLFIMILFYFLGIFLGASFYKIHVIVPLLVGYFIFLTGWYYMQRVFEWLYKRQEIGAFLGANGATIIFAVLVFAWFFVLKKYGLFSNRENEVQSDQSTIFTTD